MYNRLQKNTTKMTIVLITWAVCSIVFIIGYCRFGKGISERKEQIDNQFKKSDNENSKQQSANE